MKSLTFSSTQDREHLDTKGRVWCIWRGNDVHSCVGAPWQHSALCFFFVEMCPFSMKTPPPERPMNDRCLCCTTHCSPEAAVAGSVVDWRLPWTAPSRLLVSRLRLLLPRPQEPLPFLQLRCALRPRGWSDAPYPRNTHCHLHKHTDSRRSDINCCFFWKTTRPGQ